MDVGHRGCLQSAAEWPRLQQQARSPRSSSARRRSSRSRARGSKTSDPSRRPRDGHWRQADNTDGRRGSRVPGDQGSRSGGTRCKLGLPGSGGVGAVHHSDLPLTPAQLLSVDRPAPADDRATTTLSCRSCNWRAARAAARGSAFGMACVDQGCAATVAHVRKKTTSASESVKTSDVASDRRRPYRRRRRIRGRRRERGA